MNITSQQIRQKYLDFFEKQGHKIVPSSPLIPENDPTTLFTGSGMQPMVPYLLGEKHPLGNRICDSQKSFRSGDIEDIGDNRHTTFFEMLGNWSLGDYFKEKQVPWMFEFLTKELGLNPKNLYVTVFRGNEKYGISKDTEAVELWRKEFKNVGIDALDVDFAEEKGMQGGRIFYCPEEKNWWSRAGIPGNMPEGEPGGPDSEMFWDFGAELKMHEVSEWKDEPCHPNCDCGRFLEIGNNVFMQFQKSGDGFKELANKNIDFGGGLERLAAAIKNNPDVFFGDLFDGIRTKIEELSGKKYGENPKETKAFRVVMDHLRASTFLICDGAVPSNKDQGYFTRRLLRRAIRFARDLGINGGLSKEVALEVIKEYKDHYKELEAKKDFIVTEIEKEEKQFLATLENGLKEFDKAYSMPKYWLPGDYEDEAFRKKLDYNNDEMSKRGCAFSGKDMFRLYDTYGFPPEMTLELLQEKFSNAREKGNDAYLNEDMIWSEFNEAFKKHKDLSRAGAEQKFKGGLADSAEETTALHTAAHLMLAGIRKVLGADIHQKGSNITAERLRFDFNYPEKVPEDKLKEIENYVNNVIEKNCDMILDEIKKSEAESDKTIEGSFWEKYPEIVKVYTVKDSEGNIYSRELCGGPHITNTSTMGRFRIIKEESSSAGVRRIKAVLEK